MAGLQIPCPKCGKSLKLPDRSLLGRKGKCPKCRHAFVLTEPASQASSAPQDEPDGDPLDVDDLYNELDQIEQRRTGADEVQMELVDLSVRSPQAGTGARWVPDAAQPAAASMPPPQMMPPGYPYPMPPQGWGVPPGYPQMPYPPQPGMPYQMPPGYAPMPYGAPQYMPQQMLAPPQPAPVPPPFVPAAPAPAPVSFAPAASDNPFGAFAEPEPESAPSALPSQVEMLSASSLRKSKSKPKAKKSRQAQQKQLAAIIAIGALAVAGIVFAAMGGRSASNGKGKNKAVTQNPDDDVSASLPWESPLPVSPTKGAPIDMTLMPFGVTAIVHVRPSELWEKDSRREKFQFCWGPLGEWLGKQIKELTNHDPSKIEELTFGLIPGIVGDPLQVCGVVRLKEPSQKTGLIKVFREMQAELKESNDSDYPVYQNEKYAYVIKDLHTFAFCPRQRQTEMAESVNHPNAQAPGIESLLRKTDRLRHVVLVFEPTTLGTHAQFALEKEFRPIANRVVDFFDPKHFETVALSLHVGDKFHSEILARFKSSIAKTAAQDELKKRLDSLPRELADTIRDYMDPRKLGHRQIIGRFPAMMKAYALSTHASNGDRFVSLATVLPERAAPNLAIGTLLTWDESTRTDFTKAASKATGPTETGTKLPELVLDRLKQISVEAEFNSTPLEEAMKLIAEECKVTIDLDGDGLKDGAYTKNMKQSLTLGKVTGLQAVAAILNACGKDRPLNPMVLIIDESKKVAIISSKNYAENKGQKPFQFQ
ncbi:hypothetical protein LBMAG52_25890 [Planctomycetia bacterium]|nr:hypothetical protein LBMAG52_25890 [Planctomycetia bacterium]